jgi:hypothetical protein
LLIAAHDGTVLTNLISNVFKHNKEAESQVLCLLSLDAHDFLNALADIKYFDVFSELLRLNLSIIQHVLHNEAHHVGRRFLDLDSDLQLGDDLEALLGGIIFWHRFDDEKQFSV